MHTHTHTLAPLFASCMYCHGVHMPAFNCVPLASLKCPLVTIGGAHSPPPFLLQSHLRGAVRHDAPSATLGFLMLRGLLLPLPDTGEAALTVAVKTQIIYAGRCFLPPPQNVGLIRTSLTLYFSYATYPYFVLQSTPSPKSVMGKQKHVLHRSR